MDLQALGDLAVDRAQELQELNVAVAGQALADHRAGEHVQRGEQRGGAVALVVVGHRARPARLNRQGRLRAVKRLDLGLLVHAQHDRFSGGFRYRPTTSTSFSSKRLSLESLNVFTRCGCSCARTRSAAPSPATRRPWPSTGSSSASRPRLLVQRQCTISSTFSAGIDGLRPRPGRTTAKSFNPSSANRSRQPSPSSARHPTRSRSACSRPRRRPAATPARAAHRDAARCAKRKLLEHLTLLVDNGQRRGRRAHTTPYHKPHLFARHYTSSNRRPIVI